jgi:hypothetical protein
MTLKSHFLARSAGERPTVLLDLGRWFKWHQGRGTLPDRWADSSLSQIARDLGAPAWLAVRPWRIETPGVEQETTETGAERVTRWETSAGTLTARWTIGPDGDWWQAEHLVKTSSDLAAAVELARARSYILDPVDWSKLETMAGDDGVLAIEVPRRPYSDLLHDFLGWGEGLFLLAEPAIADILDALESALVRCVEQMALLPAHVALAPDNLDGQFVSPTAFQRYLSASYRRTAEALQRQAKPTLVHVGGPIRHLLAPLADTGVTGVEGVAGPPQSDASLTEARALAGPAFTLWGGIPQDLLLDTHDRAAFDAAVTQAAREARGDERAILGVADRVPVEADLDRLRAIPSLVQRAMQD